MTRANCGLSENELCVCLPSLGSICKSTSIRNSSNIFFFGQKDRAHQKSTLSKKQQRDSSIAVKMYRFSRVTSTRVMEFQTIFFYFYHKQYKIAFAYPSERD